MPEYTLNLSSVPLTPIEKPMFNSHLNELGLDNNIWDIYEKFLQTTSVYTKPLIARVKRDSETVACMFLIECKSSGPSLSKSKILQYLVNKLPISAVIWMKAGIAAEICASPVFINKSVSNNHELGRILEIIRKKFFLLFIHDLANNASLHPTSTVMPYTDEGIIDTSGYSTIHDYRVKHRNLKKKLKSYQKVGGRIDVIKGRVDELLVKKIKECVISTGEKSVFKLPYQNDYPDMCAGSASIDNENIIHFLCRSKEEFYGYHSFIMFKNQIRCLNGAFNRNLFTTHHAYENMIYRVVEYSIENNIHTIYFGPVLNETKKRMMNSFIQTKLYVSSNFPFFLKLFGPLLRRSRLNAKDLLKFSGIDNKPM